MQNRIVGNVVSGSGLADIGLGSLQPDLAGLGNCFADNTITTTSPTDLEALAPCDGDPTATDWAAGALDLGALDRRGAAAVGRLPGGTDPRAP